MSFKNKRILITAGPTWVPIDGVRVISNIASGKTGILLANRLQDLGARVTLLLGGVSLFRINNRISLKRFVFFEELKELAAAALTEKKYDIIIHSAAVADYKLKKAYTRKIRSGAKKLTLNLIPTPKIIDAIKDISGQALVVAFKFEPEADKTALIRKARRMISQESCDIVVANALNRGRYLAYIVKRNNIFGPLFSREALAKGLVSRL